MDAFFFDLILIFSFDDDDHNNLIPFYNFINFFYVNYNDINHNSNFIINYVILDDSRYFNQDILFDYYVIIDIINLTNNLLNIYIINSCFFNPFLKN